MPTESVPPMVRKNIELAVATPRRFQGTLAWMAMRSGVFANPSPSP